MSILLNSVVVLLLVAGLSACAPASYHKSQVEGSSSDRLTVGKVQREIKVGMSSADVIGALGSPNVVTTDEQRREVWVYDKVSTENVYSNSQGGATILVLSGYRSAGASNTSQRTLTITVKFDKESRVRDFSYHSTQF